MSISRAPDAASVAAAPAQTPPLRMIATLGLVSALCGLLIVSAYEGSLSAVQENRRIALERAVHQVLPGAHRIVPYFAAADGQISAATGAELPPGAIAFHAAYDAQGRLMGVAAEGAAKGYADTVRVLFGWSAACSCVVGMSVVGMRETPGIGDKVLADAAFKANFAALDLRLNAEMKALANEVRTVKHGTKTQPWQVDAISGATVTSRAIGRAINDAAQALLPRLSPRVEQIGKAP